SMLSLIVLHVQATEKPEDKKIGIEMPAKVKAVVEKSCYGCHNTDSKNEDAREELDFKTLGDLKAFKKIGTLRDIAEVLEEGEMPPKKFLEKYPERTPTEEEQKLLADWVKKEAQQLIDNQ
ncbi:MAG: heme-binding domain-containing protein, partial [Prolixibacteraceae bacterium]